MEHQEAVRKKHEELELKARKEESQIERLRDARCVEANKIFLKQIPKRRLVIMKKSIAPDNYLTLEEEIRERDHESNSVFLGKVGVGLSESALCLGPFSHYDLVFKR